MSWIFHPELEVHSEVQPESLPVWLDNGWQESDGPNADVAALTAPEIAARVDAGVLAPPEVVPDPAPEATGVRVESLDKSPSTGSAS